MNETLMNQFVRRMQALADRTVEHAALGCGEDGRYEAAISPGALKGNALSRHFQPELFADMLRGYPVIGQASYSRTDDGGYAFAVVVKVKPSEDKREMAAAEASEACRLHGAWLKYVGDAPRADFSDRIVKDAAMSGCDLTEAVFCGAELVRAGLKGTRLDRAEFAEAKLTGCCLANASARKATLFGAVFEDCELESALLEDCDLRKAVFRRCGLGHADLRGCDLRGSSFEGCTGMDTVKIDLCKAEGSNVMDAIRGCGKSGGRPPKARVRKVQGKERMA